MFYSQFILAKKGPLGTIWIAAHLERKLRKNQVADTDIGISVDSILSPEVPIALRLSSHLLLGVVRIYSRKVNYLFDDCSEALLNVKQAFRSAAVDLPPEESTAPYHSITLPETFDLDDFELPDNDVSQGNCVDHHVSTREQITLQDTMEGVVFTTSQFGLDERFGDGDASQIGLEYDEIDGLATAAEASQYDQGPSTPALQEPNLFDSQVDQVIKEVDYHNLADLVLMKSTQNVSSAHQREEDVTDCFLQNNVTHCDADLHHQDNDILLVELDSKREEKELLESLVVTKDQENLIPNDHCLTTSSPLMIPINEEYQSPLIPEHTDGTISASDMCQKVDDLHDKVLINNEPVVAPLDQAVMKCVISGVGLTETVASPCSHVTSDPEDLSCKLLSNLDGSQGRESDGQLEDDHTSLKHEVLNDSKIANNMGESCPYDEAQVSNAVCPLGSPGKPQLVDVESQASQELKEAEDLNSHEATRAIESHFRPCTSHLSRPCVSSIEDPASSDRQTTELSVCKEGWPDLGKSDVQHGSQIITDNQVESINKSAVSDIPEPEKMLSMAHQLGGEPNGLLIDSTPDNQSIPGSHTGGAGVKCISGKKRSYTGSTLMVQSVNLAESYGGAQSKRTAESIPDDDDFLSSILAGRKSSVLNMKPSPAAPEIASIKRSRSAPRTSALKRKVLMDDMMVLHGDSIRHQLTNTEDIRRVRKKAPCTRRELLIIQRQFLEDEIFHKPIFTGLYDNLILLRSETFDLTGIKVCDYDFDSSFIEEKNDKESYSRINVTEIRGVESNIEPVSVNLQGHAEAQPTGISVLSENHPSEVNFGSNDIDTHECTNIIFLVKGHDSSQNAEMDNGGGNIEVSDAENCSFGPGLESSSLTSTILENKLCMPNDFVALLAPMDEANDLDGSIHTGLSSIPTAQVPILEDEFVEDKGDRSGLHAIEYAELGVEIRTRVQSDSSAANNLYASLAIHCKETDEYTNNQASFSGDLPTEENGNSLLGCLNDDQIFYSGLRCDDKDSTSGCMYNENTDVDSLHSVALILDTKETSVNDEHNPACQETGLQSTMHPEISATKSPYMDHNDENFMVANDTGFLNVGDDEIIEDDDDDDDFITCAEGTHLENSGWSSRTRAVAKYLQALFDKEDLHGRKNLQLDYILAGKTPKEASRMFFETLVLKTRDYIHVEQIEPFVNINIKPRTKLMKSHF